VILKEREEKKRHKQVDEADDLYGGNGLPTDGDVLPAERK